MKIDLEALVTDETDATDDLDEIMDDEEGVGFESDASERDVSKRDLSEQDEATAERLIDGADL